MALHSEVRKEWETFSVIYEEIAASSGGRGKYAQTTTEII